MASSLSIAFDPPATGGITLRLSSKEGEFVENFSHIRSPLADLCVSLWELGRGLDARPVVLFLEPRELELRFSREDPCTLSLSLFQGRGRIEHAPVLFACQATTREFVLLFWRALRRLQTSVPPATFACEWREPFPDAEMTSLSRLVTSWRTEAR